MNSTASADSEGPRDRHEKSPKNVNISINLLAALGKLLVQLQHLADFVSVGVIGVGKVEEGDYEQSPFAYSYQIAGEHRVPYPQIKEQFTTWCIKNSFTEAVNILSIFLDECRLIAALYSLGDGTITGEQWNQTVFDESRSFHQLPFPAKIERLRTKYGVRSDFEEFVLSLNRARRCLIHRVGLVGPEDTKGGDYISIRWQKIELYTRDKVTGEEAPVTFGKPTEHESELLLRVSPVEKRFRLRERIELTPTELFQTIHTFYRFAAELLQGLRVWLHPRSKRTQRT